MVKLRYWLSRGPFAPGMFRKQLNLKENVDSSTPKMSELVSPTPKMSELVSPTINYEASMTQFASLLSQGKIIYEKSVTLAFPSSDVLEVSSLK